MKLFKKILAIALAVVIAASLTISGTLNVSAATNLVVNGDFSTTDGWVMGNDDGNPVANPPVIADGKLNFLATTTAWSSAKQQIAVEPGKTYTLSFDVLVSAGQIRFDLAGAVFWETATETTMPGNFFGSDGIGTLQHVTVDITTNSDTLTLIIMEKQVGAALGVGYVDNVSLVEVGAGGDDNTGDDNTGDGALDEDEIYAYAVSGGNTTITGLKTTISGDVTIPSTLGGCPVVSIGEAAFRLCTGVTSIVIPDSVTSIGNAAFESCRNLTKITVPDSVTSIGKYAFSGCTGLTNIIVPNGVTGIADYVFYGCTSLKSVFIPVCVARVGYYAFSGCIGLETVLYRGNKDLKNSIAFSGNNTELQSATWHYNSCMTSIEHTYTDPDDTICDLCGYGEPAVNKVINGDFGDGARGWTICDDAGNPQTATIAIADGKANFTAGTPQWVNLRQEIRGLKVGAIYKFSFKTVFGGDGIQVKLDGATFTENTCGVEGNIPGFMGSEYNSPGEQNLSLDFRATAATVTLIFKNRNGNCEGWIDDIVIVAKGAEDADEEISKTVTNGDFSTTDGWIMGDDDGNPVANPPVIADGKLNFLATTTAWSSAKQQIAVEPGKTYTLSFDVLVSAGQIMFNLGGAKHNWDYTEAIMPGNFFIEHGIEQHVVTNITATSDTVTLIIKEKADGSAVGVGWVDNVSLVEVGAGDEEEGGETGGETGGEGEGEEDTTFGTEEDGIPMGSHNNGWTYPVIQDQAGYEDVVGFPNFDFSQGFKFWGNKEKSTGAEYLSEIATIEDGVLKLDFEGQYGGLQSAPFRDDRIQVGDRICMIYDWRGDANVNIRICQMDVGWLSGSRVDGATNSDGWTRSYSDPINCTPGMVGENPDDNYRYSVIIENGDPGPIEFEIKNIRIAKYVDGKFFDLDGEEIIIEIGPSKTSVIEEGKKETVAIDRKKSRVWFEFTPSKDDYYVFLSKAASPVVANIYEGSSTSGSTIGFYEQRGNNFKVSCWMEAGKTYLLTVGYLDDVTGSFDVYIERTVPTAITELNVGEKVFATIDTSSFKYFSFTPSTSGMYTFRSKSNEDTYGYICDEDLNVLKFDDDGGDGFNFKVTYWMNAGMTYILKVKFYDESASGTVIVGAESAVLGDLNDDGKVDLLDLIRLKKFIAGAQDTDIDIALADVYNPGESQDDVEIDAFDLVYLKKYVIGLIPSFR